MSFMILAGALAIGRVLLYPATIMQRSSILGALIISRPRAVAIFSFSV